MYVVTPARNGFSDEWHQGCGNIRNSSRRGLITLTVLTLKEVGARPRDAWTILERLQAVSKNILNDRGAIRKAVGVSPAEFQFAPSTLRDRIPSSSWSLSKSLAVKSFAMSIVISSDSMMPSVMQLLPHIPVLSQNAMITTMTLDLW